MRHASFDGLRVLSLESRRAREVEKLIRTYNGDPIVVPAMREIPLESNTDCFEFGERLLNGDFDLIIFLTGIGVTKLMQTLETKYSQEVLLQQLRQREVVTRGVKPVAALRELQIPVSASTEEPSTWHEVLALLDAQYGPRLAELRVAVQEYGATNPEFITELVARCADVTKVPVYQWGLPLDLEPLRDAVRRLCDGEIDVVLFMTAVQVIHLFQIADELGLREAMGVALQQAVVVSIGPTTTEELKHYGVQPDFEPSRPRMGFMVNEAAQYAKKLLPEKRSVTIESGPRPGVKARAPYRGTVQQVAPSTSAMAGFRDGLAPFDVLQEISSHIASTDPLHVTLSRIVTLVSIVIPCDSCFLYTLEDDKLVLRASRNPHSDELDHLKLSVGEGVTGWVAEHRETVAISERASEDPRFSAFVSLPEDRFEAMLCAPVTCANRVVGVLNLQHRQPYQHSELERRMLSTVGILVGAEIERARLETENSVLTDRLETRKLVDRAKGILQRDLNFSEDDAYRNMQRESRQRRKSMREIAEAILLADSLKRDRNL
ncbi:uroporphyrinogen-III synthase [Terriglobus sp. RCC_193]|uniref:uroporphyrinogen-III synthase n=1 Tax=Terriglobus sp. RCC_193 TaxID=3239218 RepID=UPI003525524C